MKIWTSLVYLTVGVLIGCGAHAQTEPQAKIVTLVLDPQSVTVLHLHPGFVSSVRLPEDVSSVVLGDSAAFKGEHSEAEPRLVFFKPATPKPGKSNALITTRTGREFSLTLLTDGTAPHSDPIDYILEYEPQRSFLILPGRPSFLIGETKNMDAELPTPHNDALSTVESVEHSTVDGDFTSPLKWCGKELRVAVGRIEARGSEMTVAFKIANGSSRTIELLPPQVQLSGKARQGHKVIKAEPVAVQEYRLETRRLPAGASTEGSLLFERPAFKESRERLLLKIAQAEAVDRPVLVPIAFVAPAKGASK